MECAEVLTNFGRLHEKAEEIGVHAVLATLAGTDGAWQRSATLKVLTSLSDVGMYRFDPVD